MAEPVANLPLMTTDEFLLWYETQPDDLHFELLDGVVYPRRNPAIMQAERLIHAELKARVLTRFRNEIAAAKLDCSALGDGMAVRVGPRTTFEPDTLVRCGLPLPRNTIILDDVLIVVEVASPSTARIDVGPKLLRYFRNPQIRHYLMIVPEPAPVVVHHRKDDDGRITLMPSDQRIIRLDPPGLTLDVEALFADL